MNRQNNAYWGSVAFRGLSYKKKAYRLKNFPLRGLNKLRISLRKRTYIFKNFPLRGLNKLRNLVRKNFIFLNEFTAARLKGVKKSYKKKAYIY